MLRAVQPQLLTLLALGGLGIACYVVGAWQFSRRMAIQ